MTDAVYYEDVGLTSQQERLYKFMFTTGVDIDIPIVTLHFKLEVQGKRDKYTAREMQQQVGSAASRVNRKIKALGFEIKPGELKHTYRLKAITVE